MKVIIANVPCFLCDCVVLFIVGQTECSYYNSKGGGSNFLCLPNDFVHFLLSHEVHH